MTTFGDRLRQAREARAWTQSDLAVRLGYEDGRATVANWEGGKRAPGAEKVADLVSHLDVDANWLLLGVGSMNPPEPSQERQALADIAAIVDRLRAPSEADDLADRGRSTIDGLTREPKP